MKQILKSEMPLAGGKGCFAAGESAMLYGLYHAQCQFELQQGGN